jgi:hypothetical protein
LVYEILTVCTGANVFGKFQFSSLLGGFEEEKDLLGIHFEKK